MSVNGFFANHYETKSIDRVDLVLRDLSAGQTTLHLTLLISRFGTVFCLWTSWGVENRLEIERLCFTTYLPCSQATGIL